MSDLRDGLKETLAKADKKIEFLEAQVEAAKASLDSLRSQLLLARQDYEAISRVLQVVEAGLEEEE